MADSMGISTVTPCHGRVALVESLLWSLEMSRAAYGGPSETIIIDSSEPDDAARIEELCVTRGARYLRGPLSVREKRNMGIDKACHDIILFVDSDVVPEPSLLAEHARIYTEFPHVSGVLGVVRFEGKRSWVWSALRHTGMLDSFSFAEKYSYAMWGPTANLSVRKCVLDKVGHFRTSWPFRLGGDDLDLTLRITESQHYIKCNPNALVWHSTETWNRFSALVERSWRWGRMEYYIFNEHPKLRYHDFPKPSVHFMTWVVVAALLAPFHGAWVLLLPFAWILIWFVADLILWSLTARVRLDAGLALAQYLRMLYEAGTVFEFLRHGDRRILTKRIVFSPGQIVSEWDQDVRRVWTAIVTSIVAGALVLIAGT